MSKMSENRKIKKGKVEAPKPRRNLNAQELKEYVGLATLVSGEMWKAELISKNTALIHNGKEVAKQQESIVKLLDNAKENWIGNVLKECGLPVGISVLINAETGEIREDGKAKEPEKIVKIKKK